MTGLGTPLNVVERPFKPCPKCGAREPYTVYRRALKWRCGWEMPLPPIASNEPKATSRRRRRKSVKAGDAA